MIYLFDTDALIFLVRGLKTTAKKKAERERAQALVERCRQAERDGHVLGVSCISVSELEFGAQHSGRYEEESAALRKILTPFQIFDYDGVRCPLFYGRIRHDLERAGETIGAMDLLIAAHALSLDALLVTNNRSHFRRVAGLKIADWL